MEKYLSLVVAWGFLFACSSPTNTETSQKERPIFQNQGHELVYQMVPKVGDYAAWRTKKDVIYTYTYTLPTGVTDVSTEKYLFDGELSYGRYETHQRTLPDLAGPIEQGYDGEAYWLKHDGQLIDDSTQLKQVAFNRPTNFYWFAMLPKLLDPGLNYEYLGKEEMEGQGYEIVKVSFDDQGGKPTDIYQLYINQETQLVDQFLFTVADFGVMETPLLMKVKYESVEGLLIPTQRQYKRSTWDAEVDENAWITVNWSDIQFNNGLSPSDFQK